jgi:hypothetical protein
MPGNLQCLATCNAGQLAMPGNLQCLARATAWLAVQCLFFFPAAGAGVEPPAE